MTVATRGSMTLAIDSSLLVLLPLGRTAPLAHDPPTSARCGLCSMPG